ncbi:MAG: hypothetical protein ABI574_01195 [Burkholderiales bacterium]
MPSKPLQPANDFLGQEIPGATPGVPVPDTEHAMVTERYWYMGASMPAGGQMFSAGLGYYPNRGIIDGFVGVTLGDVQYCYTASRHVGDGPLKPEIGDLRITIEEPMRTHRITLPENDSGLSLDMRFHAKLHPNDEGDDVLVKRGTLAASVRRLAQFGCFEGWINVQGQRIDVRPDEWVAARDRSWGLRIEANTDETQPPVTEFRSLFFIWVCAQFDGFGIHFYLKETEPGKVRFLGGDEAYSLDGSQPSRRITAVTHDLQWHDDAYSQHLKSGQLVVHFEDGTHKVVHFDCTPGRFYLKAGLYGGINGWSQGHDKGALYSQFTRWDHTDPQHRRTLRTLADQATVFRCGDAVGYGTIQAGVSPGFGRYEQVQHAPMM